MKESTKERIENLVRNLDKIRTKEGREWMDKEFERILSEVPAEERKLCGQILREELKKRRMEIVDRRDVDVRGEMGELMQALNMSYIAREFFHKDRSWLAQRLNGNIVNGKPSAFTGEELETFRSALVDIQNRLSETISNI
jgi:hypothetical protein